VKPEPKAAPKPAPKASIVEPPLAPPAPPKWPLDIRRIHVVWGVDHQDLPSLSTCMQQALPLVRGIRQLRVSPTGRDRMTIATLNEGGGGLVDAKVASELTRGIIRCTELTGLIGARVGAMLQRGVKPDDPFDLWLVVEVPMPGGTRGRGLPKQLLPLPPVKATP
jgi:hypothetical protein